ncbi:MAG TPA: AMP-binding protein [Syntrophorhabdaceae bacterium]|nr:AMP-binding protein [Syntrophorhabdaceae bacterium]HNT69995.1 AMP-binding protein [Syntrophorhabdaceae bacterium]
MKNKSTFWNPVLETLPYERLRQLQLKKFKRIVEWAYNNSPFYKKLYRDNGFEPGDLNKFEDIQKIPKTDKGMLRDVQKNPPFPYGDILSVPIEDVTTFRQTSGTTGTPVYQADTWQDWEWWSECWSYILYAQGYRDTDRVFIPFGYNIFVAFWAGHYAAEKIGCEVVPGGVLNTEARILKMQELRCTAFMATPTYVLAMADTANKMGIDPVRDLSIRRITCAGEPGASIPATKKRIEEAWGCKVYDHIGATEIGAWSYECTSQPGGLHVNDAFFLVEIEDIETGKIIDEPGKNGKMLITAFDRLGKPCIRFDSKDVIRWANHTCECGRTFRMIDGGVVGRADDITKVKGVLLAPTAIEEVVRSFPELGDEYEVVVSKAGDVDDILLKVEMSSWHEEKKDLILARLQDQLRLKTNLGYRIEVRPHGSLPRYQVKAHRFKDLRKKEGSH